MDEVHSVIRFMTLISTLVFVSEDENPCTYFLITSNSKSREVNVL